MHIKDNLIFRFMTVQDVEQVYEIEKETFSHAWSEKSFISEIRENICARYVVACVNNQIVGYGGMWLIINEAHITNIAIKNDYQKCGIGSKLLLKLMKSAYDELGIYQMTLEVRRGNYRAQRLYRKYGFIVSGIREQYYEDNKEDAFLMWNRDTKKILNNIL